MNRAKGFTLIEVLVSATLLAVGIVACIYALSSLTQTDYSIQQREKMERLAQARYDEIMAEGTLTTGTQSGDFSDWYVDGYSWKAEVIASGITDLDQIQLTVTKPGDDKAPAVEIDGLRYTAPTTTSSSNTGSTGTGQ